MYTNDFVFADAATADGDGGAGAGAATPSPIKSMWTNGIAGAQISNLDKSIENERKEAKKTEINESMKESPSQEEIRLFGFRMANRCEFGFDLNTNFQ